MRFYKSSGGEHGPPQMGVLGAAIMALSALLILSGPQSARADSIFVTGPDVTIGPFPYATFEYTATLTNVGKVLNGLDFFRLDLIQGFVGFASAGDLAEDFSNLGVTWHGVATTLDAGLHYSLKFTRTAGTVSGPQNPLVKVKFLDIYTGIASQNALYSSQDHNKNSGALNAPVVDQALDAPDPTSMLASVPLPVTAWSGLGLCGLVFVGRRQKLCV